MASDDVSVTALTRYSRIGASSRVRFLQYVPELRNHGVDVRVSGLLGDRYLEARYAGRAQSGVLFAYARRSIELIRTRDELVWLEKEALPFLPQRLEGTMMGRFVMDIDDAWFLSYSQHPRSWVRWGLARKIEDLMVRAHVVVAGNQFLADYAESLGARAMVVPSVVDVRRYPEPPSRRTSSTTVIGWIGTPSTAKYLELLRPCLERVAKVVPIELRIIGAQFKSASFPVRCLPWSEETEVRDLHEIDIGVMPLEDSAWERGKCAYKLIQYMAAGRPVIASRVGANSDVVRDGVDGFLASTSDDWVAAILDLQDRALQARMGASGRQRVREIYSVQAQAPTLAGLLRNAAKGL